MKTQTTLRLSDATLGKLKQLAGRYGTKTEAIAVAVDRLYTAEETTMSEKMYIAIGYTQDGMFGNDPENIEGVDIPSSFEKYEEMLSAAIRAEWPAAEIKIENGIEDYHRVNGGESSDDAVYLGEIIHRVWESWDWTVPAAQ